MTRRIRLNAADFLVPVLFMVLAPVLLAEDEFAIKEGDRIVFYGDSITDQRLYTTFVETYIITRFPTMHVSFVHSGWSGDRVVGGFGGPIDQRLERDVFAYKPTFVTVMLGMNDGRYRPFDQHFFDVYAKGYEHLVESLKSHLPGVRITLIQPSPYDDVTRMANFEGGYNQVLVRYGRFVKSLAEKEGTGVVDFNAPVVGALKKAVESTTARNHTLPQAMIQDRVHPGPAAQLIMAAALLKAWHAPALVSALELDGATGTIGKSENTGVKDIKVNGTVSWTEFDSALPLPIDLKIPVIALAVKATDVESAINQQTLRVRHLSAPKYTLKIDGETVADLTKDQLELGVNLATFETPMFHQAKTVGDLTFEHNDLHYLRWRTIQVPNELRGYPGLQKALAGLDALEADKVAEQRRKAQPLPHRFELIPENGSNR
jgi:lysophospholipase L1-like esterase